MKKSLALPICGIILTFMILQVISNKKPFYLKTRSYEVKEEVVKKFIGHINTYENLMDSKGYSRSFSKEFYETISLRYRIHINHSQYRTIFGDIPFMIKYTLDETEDEYIMNRYEDTFGQIDKYKKGDDVTFYKVEGRGISFYKNIDKSKINEDGTIKLDNEIIESEEYYKEEISFYLVLVNEGEGYVVDYYERIY